MANRKGVVFRFGLLDLCITIPHQNNCFTQRFGRWGGGGNKFESVDCNLHLLWMCFAVCSRQGIYCKQYVTLVSR